MLSPELVISVILMTAGGYRNADYFKARGIMSILFLIIVTTFSILIIINL